MKLVRLYLVTLSTVSTSKLGYCYLYKRLEAFTQTTAWLQRFRRKSSDELSRPEPDMVMDKEDATAVIKDLVPESANISELFFDPCIWKVIIQCENPSDAVGVVARLPRNRKFNGWEVSVERTPPILQDRSRHSWLSRSQCRRTS